MIETMRLQIKTYLCPGEICCNIKLRHQELKNVIEMAFSFRKDDIIKHMYSRLI